MEKKYNLSLFIFRRDLRLHDNTALIQACKESKEVIPCFIFDEKQVTEKNAYKSMNALLFMIQSLQDLDSQIQSYKGHIYLFYGKPHTIVDELCKAKKIEAIFINKDYTPYSIERDQKLEKISHKNIVDFNQYDDILLNEPTTILSLKGTPYFIFTPFFKRACLIAVKEPDSFENYNFYTETITFACKKNIYDTILNNYTNKNLYTTGGTKQAHIILKKLSEFKQYNKERNFPTEHTTKLAAHLKFGTLSIRHAYHTVKNILELNHTIIRQLYWRDFFTHTAFHKPYMFGHALQEKYDALTWKQDSSSFEKWCQGITGFPIVDAGIRQLNTTGFMHNRVRMIVASFLVKDLHIDWKLGEKYFAQHLTDYDPSVNNGNWQWSASTGIDSQPYFRIFNPWLQQKKFDPQCEYIKEWIPELKNINPKIIHNWQKQFILKTNYPKPLVDHSEESLLAKQQYRTCLGKVIAQ